MKTFDLAKSIGRSPLRFGFELITLTFACFGLLSEMQAVTPAPDGGYPGANTAEGEDALLNLSRGTNNTAVGYHALLHDLDGGFNVAIGSNALTVNQLGNGNVAVGADALSHNTVATGNSATGAGALYSNTEGNFNTANGGGALSRNTIASRNTASGYEALGNNTTASGNTATGYEALVGNIVGYRNTANGSEALNQNTSGTDNTADGYQALFFNRGSNNLGLGSGAGYNLTSGSGNVCIGAQVYGNAGESNTTRIRNVYASVASGRAVYVNADNKIGTPVSSRRFKDEIKPMNKASEAILALKPVTFHYKKEIEPNRAIMFGLIAEDVEKVDPDLVTRNEKGEAEAVRYDAVNAMLLNEFLKDHKALLEEQRKVQEQQTTITQLKSIVAQQQKGLEDTVARLTARLDEHASQVQRVSAQLAAASPSRGGLEVNRQGPQIVSSNQ